jgi:hypothetical protein
MHCGSIDDDNDDYDDDDDDNVSQYKNKFTDPDFQNKASHLQADIISQLPVYVYWQTCLFLIS